MFWQRPDRELGLLKRCYMKSGADSISAQKGRVYQLSMLFCGNVSTSMGGEVELWISFQRFDSLQCSI